MVYEWEDRSLRVIVSGGGTGGHIYPAITIMRAIQEREPAAEFLYVGTRHGLESDIVPKEGIPFATVELQGFERHFTLSNVKRAGKAMLGVAKAMGIVKRFRPDVVVGTGGYVCGPVLMAASLLHVPTLIQEQNVVPGITNRLLSRFVTKVAAGVPEAMVHFPSRKVSCTGNPIRRDVMEASREEGLKAFGLDGDRLIVLISGGSRGARSINQAMVGVLKAAAHHPEVQFLHVTGKLEYEDVLNRLADAGVDLKQSSHIHVEPYLYNMPLALAVADLAIFRAGAIGLAELMARGIPSILIPYPYAAENHQEHNARAVMSAGAARMILNKDLTSDVLQKELKGLLDHPEELARMAEASRALGKPEAAGEIADIALSIAK